jgi:hypothetical protein
MIRYRSSTSDAHIKMLTQKDTKCQGARSITQTNVAIAVDMGVQRRYLHENNLQQNRGMFCIAKLPSVEEESLRY